MELIFNLSSSRHLPTGTVKLRNKLWMRSIICRSSFTFAFCTRSMCENGTPCVVLFSKLIFAPTDLPPFARALYSSRCSSLSPYVGNRKNKHTRSLRRDCESTTTKKHTFHEAAAISDTSAWKKLFFSVLFLLFTFWIICNYSSLFSPLTIDRLRPSFASWSVLKSSMKRKYAFRGILSLFQFTFFCTMFSAQELRRNWKHFR